VLVPRNGVHTPSGRSAWTTPLLSVEEGQRALGGIFEVVAPGKAGGGRAKKETHLRGTPIAAPITPFATLAAQ
jgi:hypothetical protein